MILEKKRNDLLVHVCVPVRERGRERGKEGGGREREREEREREGELCASVYKKIQSTPEGTKK